MTNEELQQEVERLESAIDWIKTKLVELLEEKGLAPVKTSYEVEMPKNIEEYVTLDEYGNWCKMFIYDENEKNKIFRRGLTFKTIEEAKKYREERMLLFKLHKWAEEQNGGWTPNWNDLEEEKYTVRYDYENNRLETFYSYSYKEFSKLPYFISDDTAQRFIEEFGEEIKEVLC